MRTIIRAKANLRSLDTKGRIVGVKKEIRISIEEHPIPVQRKKERRIYVSFADGASLDGDGGAEHRIGGRAGRGCGQHPDLYRKG
jgi:hypothetical protein